MRTSLTKVAALGAAALVGATALVAAPAAQAAEGETSLASVLKVGLKRHVTAPGSAPGPFMTALTLLPVLPAVKSGPALRHLRAPNGAIA